MKENTIDNIKDIENNKSNKRDIKATLKKAGKAFVIALVTIAVAVGGIFAFTGCKTNNNTPTQITPVTPTTNVATIQEVMNSNPTNFNKFVKSVSNEIEDFYDAGNNGNIIYMACDVNDKDKETIDDLTFYTAVKGSGDNRTIMYQTCTFDAIKAQDIADDNYELTDLTVESIDIARYDAYEKQYDDEYLNSYYGDEHDFVLKAYQKESIQHNVEPGYQAVITDVNTLISDYPTQTKNLGDKIAKAILKKYDIENPLYCGYSLFDENEYGQINGMTVSVATKTDETERKFTTYRVVFDPVYLDNIADETYTLAKTKSAFLSEQTYNAKEKQNDTEFLNNLYSQDDFSYVAYENETFEDPTIDPGEIITNYADAINANLSTHYDNVLKKAFGKNYGSNRYDVESYQWDLGNTTEDNKVQNMKLTLNYYDNTLLSQYLRVYNVDFAESVPVSQLKNSNLSSISATYTDAYTFTYNNNLQGTRTELVNAILSKAITDDFDYQNAEIMFKDNGSSTNAEFGSIRNFTIIVKNSKGIREIATAIQSADSDAELVAKLQQGKGSINFSDKITYSQNLIAEYNAGEAEMN